ncbi:MAG: hypothetical protein GXX09_01335 [Syntrophomonadaceae bacterium]|nr:hypothetical protein [Syntrophomonadaceae bacterium]
MLWGILLVLAGLGLLLLGIVLLRSRVKSNKEEDVVAYYLELAYHLPQTFYLAIAGLVTMIAGMVLVIAL